MTQQTVYLNNFARNSGFRLQFLRQSERLINRLTEQSIRVIGMDKYFLSMYLDPFLQRLAQTPFYNIDQETSFSELPQYLNPECTDQ